jgi:hypothetical protein
MAQKAKRNSTLRHLTRELVRENFSVPEVLESLADSMDEEAKRVEQNPQCRAEVRILEQHALKLRHLADGARGEFSV